MKPLKYILIFFIAGFGFLQLFQPDYNEGVLIGENSFETNYSLSDTTKAILRKACYDCHSDSTKYPYYAKINPVSWWINDHVVKGKKAINFSQWNLYSDSIKQVKLEKSIDLVERRWMPLQDYLLKHPEAYLSREEIAHFSEELKNLN